MTKMTAMQAVEAIRELTTKEEIMTVLMNCTKAGISEAFTTVMGEKPYPQSWTKGDLAERSARRIAVVKENAKFLSLGVMEKVGYLSVGTDLSLRAPVEKCSLYELFVIAQELEVRYDDYKTRIEKICAKAIDHVSSKLLAYYLSTQLSQLIKANVEYRWLHDGKIASTSAGTSESDSPTGEIQSQTQEDSAMTNRAIEDAVNEVMETVAVMTSAGDNSDNTRYVAMTKALKKYPLSVLKEVVARNNFNFKAYRLNKEEYAQELSNEIIRLLDFIDDDGREYQVTPLGAMRRDFLDGKMTYVESDVRDQSVIDFLRSVLSNRPDSQTLLDLFSCEFLYQWITCTPDPHAFRHLDEAQLRIMTGFRCLYNDRGIDSGMSIKIDLNTVEVRDTKLAGKCFAEFVQRRFARECERATGTKQTDSAEPKSETVSAEDETSALKSRVKAAHRKLVREGKYDTARAILRFLRKGETTLGLGDVSMEVEKVLLNVGCEIRYSRTSYNARAYLRPEPNYARFVEEGYAEPWLYVESSEKSAALMKEQLLAQPSTAVEASTHNTARVIDICAGVENYGCGKLTKTELGEILSQASSEALRKYILEVIADESVYELKKTA